MYQQRAGSPYIATAGALVSDKRKPATRHGL